MAPSADRQGYWGRPTSTLDWCEENYVASFYIAEFWNTVSNLIMIVPPIFGAIQTFRDGLEFRYVCSFLGLAAVGVGSWCFHMTLLYEMQLLDELPMIYSTCIFVYCLYECFKQEKSISLFLIALLLIFSVSVTVVYLQWKEPVFHQVLNHQADDKELVAVKANCGVASHRLCLGQKVALEHTTQTTAGGHLPRTFCVCVRGDNSECQQ